VDLVLRKAMTGIALCCAAADRKKLDKAITARVKRPTKREVAVAERRRAAIWGHFPGNRALTSAIHSLCSMMHRGVHMAYSPLQQPPAVAEPVQTPSHNARTAGALRQASV
jgi:hypothetical protein